LRIKTVKNEERTDRSVIGPFETDDGKPDDALAYSTCFIKCVEADQNMMFFVVDTDTDSDLTFGCYCTRGKLKKVQDGRFKTFAGPLDLDSGTLLLQKGKKWVKHDGDACDTTANPVPAPTEFPTKDPTQSPTIEPTQSPTTAPTGTPTMIYDSKELFVVNHGDKVDASDLWSGKEAASGNNLRSDSIDSLGSFQELHVSIVKNDNEVAYYTFANSPSDGKLGWFSFKNLAATNYPDLTEKPEFFQIPAWDEAKDSRYNGEMRWTDNTPLMGASFSEENGGLSDWKPLPMVGMKCSGGHCDNKQLRRTDALGNIVNEDPGWVKKISEECPNCEARCPAGKIVCKIKCTGDNCDNMDVYCCTLKEGWTVTNNAVTSGWFSEENGGTKDCGTDRYVTGLKCRGDFCDDVQLWCSTMTARYNSAGRDFYITKSHGGCDKDNGWLTLDSGKDDNRWDPCAWEGEGQGLTAIGESELRIYFAPNNQLANPYESKAQLADSMTVTGLTYKSGYIPVYKLGTGTETQFNFFEQWMGGGAINMDAEVNLSDPKSGFRHSLLDVFMKRDWYGKVKIDLYAADKVAKTIEFMSNPGDARTNGWMTQSNILSSDWAGVKPGMTSNFFSVEGDKTGNRRMFIQHNYDGCEVDSGWLVVQTMRRESMCPWEADGKQPFIYYAPGDDNVKWQTAGDYATADSMVISIDFARAIPYTRKVKGCVSGANIVKTTMRTVAECAKECDENDECVAFEYGVNYGAQNAYAPYDCQLQSSADSKDCNGEEHNLDLYVFDGRRRL